MTQELREKVEEMDGFGMGNYTCRPWSGVLGSVGRVSDGVP